MRIILFIVILTCLGSECSGGNRQAALLKKLQELLLEQEQGADPGSRIGSRDDSSDSPSVENSVASSNGATVVSGTDENDQLRTETDDLSKSSSLENSQSVPVETIESIPEDKQDSATGDTMRSASDDKSGSAPVDKSGSTPGTKSGSASDDKPESATEDTPEFASGDWSGSASGDISEMENAELDWSIVIQKKCGIDIKEFYEFGVLEPVSANESIAVLRNMSAYVNNVSAILDSHRDTLKAILSRLSGASFEDIMAHRDLFDEFRGAALDVQAGGLCQFVRLSLVAERLQMAGAGPGFSQDEKCQKSLDLLRTLYASHDDDYDEILRTLSQNMTLLRRLSRTVAADMSCILQDVADFRDFVILINSTQGAKLSLRQITIGLASIKAWGSLLTKEIYTYHYTVGHVMMILDDLKEAAQVTTTEAPAEPTTEKPNTKNEEYLEKLRSIQSYLNVMDQWR